MIILWPNQGGWQPETERLLVASVRVCSCSLYRELDRSAAEEYPYVVPLGVRYVCTL
jgi:hypothetical protein